MSLQIPKSVPTTYWHQTDDGRIQCDVCPRACKLKEGQRGLCFVRACENQQIVLTTYGRSSGFCIDPVEKKPLNHFLPGTPVLSFGTAGCNLACKFCQNWDMSKSREMDTLADAATPEMIALAAEKYACRSIAYTYNDPVIFLEYAVDIAQACKEKDIKSIAVTAGYIEEKPRELLFSHMDATNVDLKSFSEKFYWKVTGGHLQAVLETLEYIYAETDVWLEITNLMIPGENDSDKEIHEMTQWIVEKLGPDVPLHFSAFHPDWKMMQTPATPAATLIRARDIAQKNGIHYAYTGNVHHVDGDTTYCRHCGSTLIVRDWYEITSWQMQEAGRCVSCGESCEGVFEALPGQWGRKRLPVRLSAPREVKFNAGL